MMEQALSAEHNTPAGECYDSSALLVEDQDSVLSTMCDRFESDENANPEYTKNCKEGGE